MFLSLKSSGKKIETKFVSQRMNYLPYVSFFYLVKLKYNDMSSFKLNKYKSYKRIYQYFYIAFILIITII